MRNHNLVYSTDLSQQKNIRPSSTKKLTPIKMGGNRGATPNQPGTSWIPTLADKSTCFCWADF